MKRRRLIFVSLFFALVLPLPAGSEVIAAVQRADAARIQATIARDAPRLAALLSDDLAYGHNDGRVQTKAEFIDAVASNRVKYEAVDYAETKLIETAPGVVTMTGRVRLKASRAEVRVEFALRFLAVWRNEDGQWRLHAYQSAKLPDIAPPAGKASP